MKIFSLFAFALVGSLAFSTLAVSAAPPYPYPDQPVSADWWLSYLNTHAHKQPPSNGVVYRARSEILAQHFEPFRQRLELLTRLKQWVLNNKEARNVLTNEQKVTLRKPFFGWDQRSLQTEGFSRPQLASRVEQESELVEKTEGVLHDIATFLPDLKARW